MTELVAYERRQIESPRAISLKTSWRLPLASWALIPMTGCKRSVLEPRETDVSSTHRPSLTGVRNSWLAHQPRVIAPRWACAS